MHILHGEDVEMHAYFQYYSSVRKEMEATMHGIMSKWNTCMVNVQQKSDNKKAVWEDIYNTYRILCNFFHIWNM